MNSVHISFLTQNTVEDLQGWKGSATAEKRDPISQAQRRVADQMKVHVKETSETEGRGDDRVSDHVDIQRQRACRLDEEQWYWALQESDRNDELAQ